MEKARHCLICENQVVDYYEGTICGLSMEKPRFGATCREISFGEKLEKRQLNVTEEFEALRKSNFVIYAYFVVFNLIGLAVIGGGILLFQYTHGAGSEVLLIGAIGISVNMVAITTLREHLNKLKIARRYKVELDEILTLYRQ